jgi:hypothetical protein
MRAVVALAILVAASSVSGTADARGLRLGALWGARNAAPPRAVTVTPLARPTYIPVIRAHRDLTPIGASGERDGERSLKANRSSAADAADGSGAGPASQPPQIAPVPPRPGVRAGRLSGAFASSADDQKSSHPDGGSSCPLRSESPSFSRPPSPGGSRRTPAGPIMSLGKQAVDTPIAPTYTAAPDAAPRQTGPPGKTKRRRRQDTNGTSRDKLPVDFEKDVRIYGHRSLTS